MRTHVTRVARNQVQRMMCGAIAALGAFVGAAFADGPDIIVGDVFSYVGVGRGLADGRDVWGYMLSKADCNIGDTPIDVFVNTNRHPVVTMNLYRHRVVEGAGRFEHVGMSHCFHEFVPLQQRLCSATCTPDSSSTSRLGVGCSTPDSASIMAQPFRLGPRDEVNAFTGEFPFPFRSSAITSNLARVLQVRDEDIQPAMNVGAQYVTEAHLVAPDDAAAGNGANNASYRMTRVSGGGTGAVSIAPAPGSTTQREQPGIRAWAEIDPMVRVIDVDVAGEGRFVVAWRVTALAACRWHYEYAIQNVNSDRAGGAFVLPLPAWMSPESVGFHDPDRHSGDLIDNADWVVERTPTALEWRSPRTFEQDPLTNALRWGTMYTFRFDLDRPPVMGQGTLRLFKPGTPTSVSFALDVPGGCVADVDDGTGTGRADCGVTIDDLLYYLAIFADGASRADVDDGTSMGTPDGGVTIDDLLYFVDRFAGGC